MWIQTEFRIGNLISLTDISVCKVTGVLPHRVYYTPMMSAGFAEYLYALYVYVKPIPLTDELLFAAGFIRLHGYPEFFLEGFGSVVEYSDGGYGWSYNDGLTVQLKYLHHLQNLYFYTTTKELDIEKVFLLLREQKK